MQKPASARRKYFYYQLPQRLDVKALNKLINFSIEEGFVVNGEEVKPWRLAGLKAEAGHYYLYGSAFKGYALAEVFKADTTSALADISKLALSLQTLVKNGVKYLEILPDTIYFLKDGSVLFLPPTIFKRIRSLLPENDPAHLTYLKLNNPYARDLTQGLAQSLVVLAYKILTKRYPFEAKTQEELKTKIRNSYPLHPRLLVPQLKQEVADRIAAFFKGRETLLFNLKNWPPLLANWLTTGIHQKTSSKERAALKRAKEKELKAIKGRLELALFWEKHGRRILTRSLVGLATVALAIVILVTVLRPRLTKGLSPLEVVKTYYHCLNSLEVDLLRDCLIDGAGQEELSRAEWMYVTTRQMYAYEQKVYRIPADFWEKQGRKPVTEPYFIDGVAGLELAQLVSEPEPEFKATYERWLYQPSGPFSSGQMAYHCEDRLVLKKIDSAWAIYRITRLKEYPLEIHFNP